MKVSHTTLSHHPQGQGHNLAHIWSEAVTLSISCLGHISYKGWSNLLQLHMIITHSMQNGRTVTLDYPLLKVWPFETENRFCNLIVSVSVTCKWLNYIFMKMLSVFPFT